MRRLLPILLLTACTPLHAPKPCETCPPQQAEIEVSVCVDSAFSDEATEAAHVACDDWTAALCGLVLFTPLSIPGDDPPAWCDVTVLRPFGKLAAKRSEEKPGAVSFLAPRVAYVLPDVVDPDLARRVFAHEIGHTLGVNHVIGDSVMRQVNPTECVDRYSSVKASLHIARNGIGTPIPKGTQ